MEENTDMPSLQYINEKLSDAVYTLAVHEGDARTRLARVIPKIMIHSPSSFPKELQKDFEWIQSMIKKGCSTNPPGLPPPAKLTGIKNTTASEVIKKLVFIQEEIATQLKSNLDS
jgi:hypothetical protein